MKSIRYILFSLCLLSGISVFGQQLVLKADTVVGVPGDSVTVSIKYQNFSNVGAVTLYLSINNAVLKWGRALNWDAGFNNGFNLANISGSTIALTCINFSGFTASQGTLLDLRFKYMSGSPCPISFVGNCEVADVNGNPVTPVPVYKNGLVVSVLDVTPTATPATVCLGGSSTITANASGLYGSYNYQWASLSGPISNLANPVVMPTITTRYFVTVTASGYADTSSVLVNVLNLLSPAAVSSMIPSNGASGVESNVVLSWAPAANATSYDLYFWLATSPMPLVATYANLTQITKSLYNLNQGATYRWKVVSKNACLQTTGPISEFTILALPELHITQVTVSAAYAGQPIEVSWTVKNDGLGATTTPLWFDRIWISPDIEVRIGEENDQLLGTFPNLSYLGPGDSYTQTQTVTLPANLIGTYFIFVITDALDALFINFLGGVPQLPYAPPPYATGYTHGGSMVDVVKEVSDNPPYHDNFFYKEVNLVVPPLPDLKVISVLKPASIFSGQPVNVNWTVLNDGQATSPVSSWFDRIYLSADTVLNPATAFTLGTFQHNGLLAPDSIYSKSALINIPNYIFGNYFVYVSTDIYNTVFEHVYEGNNTYRSDTLKIFLTPPPDLVVSSITIPASASNKETALVKFTVENLGATATTANAWRDKIFLSQSPAWDPASALLVYSQMHYGNLNSFSPYSVNVGALIPANISGAWYVYVWTDADLDVFEYTNETNNILRSTGSLNILNPDLLPVSIMGPAADSTDQPVLLSWYDKNAGPGNLLNPLWNDRLSLSLNAVFDANNVIVFDSISNNFAINAGDSLSRQTLTSLPNVNSGLYYLYVTTDSKYQVYEGTQEGNNSARSLSTIDIRRPDLQISSVTSAGSSMSGLLLPTTVVLKNTGAGNVLNKLLSTRVYLSPTPVFDINTAIELGTFAQLSTLAAGDSLSLQWDLVLPDGLTGTYYLACYADFANVVKEGSYENNNLYVSASPLVITNGPWADLQPTNVNAAASVVAGNTMALSFTIRNTGSKNTANLAWKDKIYLSSSPIFDSLSAIMLKTIDRTAPLAIDSAYTVNTTVAIPVSQGGGSYYLFVVTDATKKIFEYTDEDNNASTPLAISILAYPLDLEMQTCAVNTTTLQSGQAFQFTYTIQNIGPVITTATQWYDAVYLSSDTILNSSTDLLVSKWLRPGPLAASGTYTLTKLLNIPNGVNGNYYMIAVTDLENANHDIFLPNNVKILSDTGNQAITMGITLTPPPDLVVQAFIAPPQAIVGQAFKLHFTIKNQGTGAANENWQEKVYLSQDFEINTGDINLGNFLHSGALLPGESYSDSLELTISQNVSANFLLILKTDGNNDVYEHNQEGNNIATSFLIVSQAPPVDLVVEDISGPPLATVGENVSISWLISNIGSNPAFGQLKDAIYLSLDTIYDAHDLLWGIYQGPLSIPAQGTQSRSTNLVVPGVALGSYHIIVRTDLMNTFPETNDTNNTSASAGLVAVDFQSLQLEVTTAANMQDLQNLYYKLVIPDNLEGETFLLSLKGDSINGVNEIFASLNEVPGRINHQFAHRFPFRGNQELLIPAIHAGTYYFLVTGSTIAGDVQNITLLPRILTFEIRSVDSKQGGNSGNVTVLISGSKFSPDMTVALFRDSVERQAKSLQYIDPTTIIATFSLAYFTGREGDTASSPLLQGIPLGFYDVVGKKPNGETAVLADGFEVIQGTGAALVSNIQYPATVRPNRFFSMSIQFVNDGNTDINIPKRTLMSLYGAPLGFSTEALVFNIPDLFLEFREAGGPALVLRPGAVSEIKIYCKSSTRLAFKLLDN